MKAFRDGLHALAWVEGQTVVIKERFAEGQKAQVADLAHEPVTRQVKLMLAPNAIRRPYLAAHEDGL